MRLSILKKDNGDFFFSRWKDEGHHPVDEEGTWDLKECKSLQT